MEPARSRDDDARALAEELSVSVTAAAVLLARGVTEAAPARKFLDPKLADLSPPAGMKGRSEAAARLARAIRQGERICVFGDYDADGVTSTALLTDVLRALGGQVQPLLADRFEGGYGFSSAALARVVAAAATVLVTCDCGTSDHPRLHEAKRLGLDVIVIDHHRVPEEPLPALAFLNPHRGDCGFAYKGLASVGLALSVAAAVRAELGVALDVRAWLDLVALGTIADVAPLDGDNRALVRAGLARMASGARPGVRALMSLAKVNPARVTGEDVAFRLAPRLNAPGRLGRPDQALALLLARTDAEAQALAFEVDQVCTRRKEIDRAVLAEAEAMLEDPALLSLPVIVLGKDGWHPGVVGIVAGRLAAKHGKPTIVIGFQGGEGRGSVRGPAGFSLYGALAKCEAALLGFGGHDAAAGVHVAEPALGRLRDLFAEACHERATTPPPAKPVADASLSPGDDPARVLRDLERFEPCGHGNPAPQLGLVRAEVRGMRVFKDAHLALDLQVGGAGGVSLRGFGYQLASHAKALGIGSFVHATGALRWDDFRGNGAVELRLAHLEPL